MEIIRKLRRNLITNNVNPWAFKVTLLLMVIIQIFNIVYSFNLGNLGNYLSASGGDVFTRHQYYRLWTTLFVHADFAHLGGNLFLFIPFAYFLIGHFGICFFPLLGIFLGGVINYIVLKTMPSGVHLIGISGVVYWMGASYITLNFLIDRRDHFRTRLLKNSGIMLIIFFPTVISVEVSYLTHFVGFVFGIFSGVGYYYFNKKKILKLDEYEYLIEGDENILEEIYSSHPDYHE